MSKRKVFWVVLITIVAVFALAAGGYALYRWGYARGVAADMGEIVCSHFSDELPAFDRHMLGGRMAYWGQMDGVGFLSRTTMPFHWVGGLFGVLLGTGVLALAGYGVVSLIRGGNSSSEDAKAKK
jgi:hypothetical protein